MSRGPLYQDNYRPQFSGHETFPLRYGWLKKAFDAVFRTEGQTESNKSLFVGKDAIAHFGVGKNMVAAIRHWATVTGIIEEDNANSEFIKTTQFGKLIFGPHGLDPYMEHPSTLWLIHWRLCGHPEKTTWFWVYNHYPGGTFDRERVAGLLRRLSEERNWLRVAPITIKRDVECFVRSYVLRSEQLMHEDNLESPLAELSLIKPAGRRDIFQLVRGVKPSLSDIVFLHALIDFWDRFTKARTLSFELIAHEPGSPGRVFLLDEDDLADRLMRIDDISHGALRWSETAGLKQVIREGALSPETTLEWLQGDFRRSDSLKEMADGSI